MYIYIYIYINYMVVDRPHGVQLLTNVLCVVKAILHFYISIYLHNFPI